MKTKSQLSSFCVALVILSSAVILHGCTVVFTNPPPGSQHTRADTKLMGKWMGQDEKGNRGFIEFDKGSNTEIHVSIFGEKGDLGYQNPVFTMITKKIGTYNYMVINATEPSAPPGYVLARFSHSPRQAEDLDFEYAES